MNKRLYDIYDLLYSDYVYDVLSSNNRRMEDNEYYFTRIIRKAIDQADNNDQLRPDAKYFLIVNFHNLIVRPLLSRRPFDDFRNGFYFSNLEDDIQTDIEKIVQNSTSSNKENEISGHQIMKSIDILWKSLRTTSESTWG